MPSVMPIEQLAQQIVNHLSKETGYRLASSISIHSSGTAIFFGMQYGTNCGVNISIPTGLDMIYILHHFASDDAAFEMADKDCFPKIVTWLIEHRDALPKL